MHSLVSLGMVKVGCITVNKVTLCYFGVCSCEAVAVFIILNLLGQVYGKKSWT